MNHNIVFHRVVILLVPLCHSEAYVDEALTPFSFSVTQRFEPLAVSSALLTVTYFACLRFLHFLILLVSLLHLRGLCTHLVFFFLYDATLSHTMSQVLSFDVSCLSALSFFAILVVALLLRSVRGLDTHLFLFLWCNFEPSAFLSPLLFVILFLCCFLFCYSSGAVVLLKRMRGLNSPCFRIPCDAALNTESTAVRNA